MARRDYKKATTKAKKESYSKQRRKEISKNRKADNIDKNASKGHKSATNATNTIIDTVDKQTEKDFNLKDNKFRLILDEKISANKNKTADADTNTKSNVSDSVGTVDSTDKNVLSKISQNTLKEKEKADSPLTQVTKIAGAVPTYGNYIKDRKRFNKHAKKVKQYAQPYQSVLTAPDASESSKVTNSHDTAKGTKDNDTKMDDSTVSKDTKSKDNDKSNENDESKEVILKQSEGDEESHPLSEKTSKLEGSRRKVKLTLKNKPTLKDSPILEDKPVVKENPSKKKQGSKNIRNGKIIKNDQQSDDKSSKSDESKFNDFNVKEATITEFKEVKEFVAKEFNDVKEFKEVKEFKYGTNEDDLTSSTDNKLKTDYSKLNTDSDNFKLDAKVDKADKGRKTHKALKSADTGNPKEQHEPSQESHKPSDRSDKSSHDESSHKKPIQNKQDPIQDSDKESNPSAKPISPTEPAKIPTLTKKQQVLENKIDKLNIKTSKLDAKQEKNIGKMPFRRVRVTERTYNEKTGKVQKTTKVEKQALHQSETRWNNPKFTQKLAVAKGAGEKIDVIAEAASKGLKKVAVVAVASEVAPVVAGAIIAKPVLKYGSKLMVNSAVNAVHSQVRKDIERSDNEVLKAAHWAEQKGEHAVTTAVSTGFRKLNPRSIHRYIKNAPYRRESRLQIKQLKNDKKIGLLRVKQSKETGINHRTGKNSNILSRAWQRRQIKKNYQKAMIAAKGKSKDRGMFGEIATEIARGNPKGVLWILGRRAGVAAIKATVFNPVFWKLLFASMLLVVILGSVQACVAIIAPTTAGVGFVGDDDISFVTRRYSEWETDLRLFLSEDNITEEFTPPEDITNQPGINGEIVYPEAPYTAPPPFYEYHFETELGNIGHDPMELISYLTARHGERFDPDSENPMTRDELEALLKEIFEEQYGIPPNEFDTLLQEEIETRFRRERRIEQVSTTEIHYDSEGNPYTVIVWHNVIVYHDIYYEFWILTILLEPRNLTEVLRGRLNSDDDGNEAGRELHFDVLNLTGNGRQVVGNPFDFNWLPFITSHYGFRINPTGTGKQLHLGIDIARPTGTPIFATHTGRITQVQHSNTGYGNMVRLRGEGIDGLIYEVIFAHLDQIYVTNGQYVEQGDLMATVGNTGDSTGAHLHLEVFRPTQSVRKPGNIFSTQLPSMHLNPIFAVITWTNEESNALFRNVPSMD